MNSRSDDGADQGPRLDSWESIGQFLGRSARTVQRWHGSYGLPVHHFAGKRGAVYAYPGELDSWMKYRDAPHEPAEAGRPVLLPPPVPSPDPVSRNHLFDPSLVPGVDRAHAAELVAHAYRMWEILSYSNLKGITRHFREAIDLDPGSASAFAGLANALIAEGLWGLVAVPEVYDAAAAAMLKAFEIDSDLLEAKCARAWLDMLVRRNWEAARSGFDLLLKQNHPSTRALIGMAMLHIAEANLEQASDFLRQAARQSTLSASPAALYCWQVYLSGEFARALDETGQVRASGRFGPVVCAVEALASLHFEDPIACIRRIETLVMDSPQFDLLKGVLGYVCALNGHTERAMSLLDAMTPKGARSRAHEPYAMALILIGLKRNRDAVDRLEQSYLQGSLWSLGFNSDPALEPLRNDPNYLRLMSKITYPLPARARSPIGIVG